MHTYTVFTSTIVVYIHITDFTLKPHSILLKNYKSDCSDYTDTIVDNDTF